MKVSWDDDIPNCMESHTIHVPNQQPDTMTLGPDMCPLGFSSYCLAWNVRNSLQQLNNNVEVCSSLMGVQSMDQKNPTSGIWLETCQTMQNKVGSL